MKSKIRILSVVVLTAIYCFAIGAVNNSLIHSEFSNNLSSMHEKVISDLSEKLFCHTSKSESSVYNYKILSAPNFKNQFTALWAIFKANEHLFESEFSQYTTITRSILIKHPKSDIIFPFHYFL